ncbi:MAG: hypothetical protein NTX17_00035 [Candidatus Eisenbacteria bacterium]|nr:hypothetical protein [Candidatus Eisenbacteria bacterium]
MTEPNRKQATPNGGGRQTTPSDGQATSNQEQAAPHDEQSTPDSEQTMAEVFSRAIEIEKKAADIFTELSSLFSHIPNISAFWKGMAADEVVHMDTLQDIRGTLTQEQLSLPPEKQILKDICKVEDLLKGDLIGPIRNLDDAYELAHEMEYSEVNAIFRSLATGIVPSEKLVEFVSAEMEQHLKKIIDFTQNFGDRAWRRQISIRHAQDIPLLSTTGDSASDREP